MGVDDGACNTGLVLGLGFFSTPETPTKSNNQSPNKPSCLKFEQKQPSTFEPSLTLGLCGDQFYNVTKKFDVIKGGYLHHHDQEPTATAGDLYRRQASPHNVVSSLSSGRVKRERELSSEEVEVEKISYRFSDEDEEGVNARKKLRLTKQQSALLEESFKQRTTLNSVKAKASFGQAIKLSLTSRQVEVWFQNRRARTKLKQTEVDCEFLKKCCETLTDENRRLQKELKELKALKMAARPFYRQMPAATLTMCPSCERTDGVGDGNSKSPFSMAKKPPFYNPFSNPSAAC